MQFISNGPDIPDALLMAHEEGRVVFFCGAGISYPAGLPDFAGLVDQIYQGCFTQPSEIEQSALGRRQFDAALDLLERRLPGQRLAVRNALAGALKPKLRRKGAIDTHTALLRLGRSRDGKLRLVTTNFDRMFHHAAKRTAQSFQTYAAPMLPIPKSSRWNGLVCLHGLLAEKLDETALNRLVLTSGDFGLAYLTERWAARFVGELFRNYVVCFIGYSINDPVLRYMMDALAADRMLGEVTPQAWAFGDYEPGREHAKLVEWKAKGVSPILYEVPAGNRSHSALHKTLHVWADTYRDGVLGKERIVVSHALASPTASTKQDDFVGRMLWALSDPSGLPAKRFAEFNPVPPLDWLLEGFIDERFRHGDLRRFGVPPRDEVDIKLRFSLIHRPAAYMFAPWMLLVSGFGSGSQWDGVMFHLARWLLRHLNDPKLVLWLAQRGGRLVDRLAQLIERELERLTALEREGKAAELAEISSHASNAVPSTAMRTLWRLMLGGRIKSSRGELELYRWKDQLERDGLTATVRFELRKLLAPKIELRPPFRWSGEKRDAADPGAIRNRVDWELVLSSDDVRSALLDIDPPCWSDALPHLLEEFQQLLRDALDLMHELDEANHRHDRSLWDLPSISDHRQNRHHADWVVLIELLRDAWLAFRNINGPKATRIAQTWFELPNAAFKRLALFAASRDGDILSAQWVSWLLSDSAWWLWAQCRETFRLLVLRGSQLPSDVQDVLEAAILAGPPREDYRDDLSPDKWQEILGHAVWLRLAKLSASGLALSAGARSRLDQLSRDNPGWQLAANESDEFETWLSGTGDPEFEQYKHIDVAPRTRSKLLEWLKKEPSGPRPFYEDTWGDLCRKEFFRTLNALCVLSRDEVWPAVRWGTALRTWSDEKLVKRSWQYSAPLVHSMPDAVVLQIARDVTWWLNVASKSSAGHSNLMLDLCRRVLDLPLDESTGMTRDGVSLDEPVTDALNHPVGHVTQALINLWFKDKPEDGDGLPNSFQGIFTRLCDVQVKRFRHGRVLLSSQLIALFRVDLMWTEQNLLPLFSWKDPNVARAVWLGFLWSPRLYPPLLRALKTQFLETAGHYNELGQHRRQFAGFLTYAALEPVDGYSKQDFRTAFEALPLEGLEECAQALSQALVGATEQREMYWRNRILPFWKSTWPKSIAHASPRIAKTLARLSIAAGSEFPAALRAVQSWLQPIESLGYVVRLLDESDLCTRYPEDALRLLHAVIGAETFAPSELGSCLNQIGKAGPKLMADPEYQRLLECSRKWGV